MDCLANMKLYFFVYLTPLVFIGCFNGSSESDSDTYFGGEIIKPNNNYVVLENSLKNRDTFYLNDDNRFLEPVKNLQPGVYRFQHGDEFQTLILEGSDSLLFRLNTDDFDESLVYTGRGAKKNNFLIQSYLDDESKERELVKHQQMEPEEFQRHVDMERRKKFESFERFLSKTPQSELFRDIVTASIDYNFFYYREKYPFGHYGENKLVHFKDLPDGFYDFRAAIDYNKEELIELTSYRRFLFWHFNNLALAEFYPDGKHIRFDRQSLKYNVAKLNLIVEKVENEKIKNFLLRSMTSYYLLNNDNAENSAMMLTEYLKKASDQTDKDYIKGFYDNLESLKPGNPIPNSELYTYGRDQVELRSIITKPTVVFCWLSRNKMHTRNSHYMAKSLKARFPEINFIAINATDNDLENWKRTVSKFDYPSEHEYLFKNTQEAIDKYVMSYGHKVFILDKNGIIQNSNASLFGSEIQDELETLLATSTK